MKDEEILKEVLKEHKVFMEKLKKYFDSDTSEDWAIIYEKIEYFIKKAITLTRQSERADFLDLIDEMDVELFLEDVVDIKTGKRVEIPKEIKDLWDIYWEHISEKLKQKVQELEGGKE